jgi:hypothetical protein
MAKDDQDGEIQFVFLNLKGSQTTLQEALRQAGNLMNRATGPSSPPRTYIAVPVPPQALGDGNQNGGGATQQVYEVVDAEPDTPGADGSSNSNAAGAAKPQRARKAPKTPNIINDIGFGDAEVTFTDYVKQKDASNDFKRYLVIAAWLRKYKNVEAIGPAHIYTAFQFMKWPAPDDMGQPFRDMKRKHSYFENGGRNLWKITIIGLNEVDRMEAKGDEEA